MIVEFALFILVIILLTIVAYKEYCLYKELPL